MKIILASSSPRRQQILKAAGFDFEILKTEADESYPANLNARKVPAFLANKKMQKAKQHIQDKKNTLIITADTVVILNNEIIGKPVSDEDAKNILTKLSGKMHEVITGVCLYTEGRELSFDTVTSVFMEQLNPDEINFYVHAYKPFDKAGAYAIQEWIGINKISKIEGDYYNVVGFPMATIYRILKNEFNV